MAKLRFLMTL